MVESIEARGAGLSRGEYRADEKGIKGDTSEQASEYQRKQGDNQRNGIWWLAVFISVEVGTVDWCHTGLAVWWCCWLLQIHESVCGKTRSWFPSTTEMANPTTGHIAALQPTIRATGHTTCPIASPQTATPTTGHIAAPQATSPTASHIAANTRTPFLLQST
ncbi:keratin associated protein 9 1 [Echinococcus multilocularis]|uniref:Keratin associated protein 9 1 n=1 Tax=Echinococcus multilocularis TaxID=6211 RepID=A0A0S4MNQ3_ECHMU|nr:keratin associated protein 9 1 [Echinococcus multilocularis]